MCYVALGSLKECYNNWRLLDVAEILTYHVFIFEVLCLGCITLTSDFKAKL